MTHRLFATLANAFPLWVLAAALTALFQPEWFAWFARDKIAGQSYIVWGLALVMLGMGLTLTVDDFKSVFRMPKAVALGVTAQFTIMPLSGWLIATVLKLPTPFAVGLILTACCPGGTASNIVTYMARAHVALSVLMTMSSTFAALVLTPLLTGWLAGHLVPVDKSALFLDTLKVVVIPVLAGVLLNHSTPRLVRWTSPFAPLLAALTVAMICASIVALHPDTIRQHAGWLMVAVFMLHACGFGFGYVAAKVFGFDLQVRRTASIEVGMQNSGLAVFLARQHFADPLTVVPGAISSVFHSVMGSLLAGYWRWRRSD
jgi:BASS family bile acid:Na+ symporter